MTSKRKLGRTCSTCGKGITDESTTGRCKPCHVRASNADPELRKRRGEALSRRIAEDKALFRRKCEILKQARASRDLDALKQRGMKLVADTLPKHETKRRKAHREAMRERRHAWLPDDLRPLYEKMLRNNGFRAPQAKRIILDHLKAKARQSDASLSATNDAVLGSQRLRDAILEARR